MSAPLDTKPLILALFALTYLGLAVGRIPGLRLNRSGIALLGAIAMMIVCRNPTAQTFAAINWPTICLLFGFFVIAAQLRLSGFYDLVAAGISARVAAPSYFLAFLIAVTAALSAFLNNDIICYVMTPVVATALVRRRINPVPYLVALAAASNVGAAATLIGNAQNMMIGSVAGLSFGRYLLWTLPPVAVGLGAIFVVVRLARDDGPPVIRADEVEPAASPQPFNAYHAGKGLVILFAVIALFFTSVPREITVLAAAGIHLVSTKFRTDQLLGLVDWQVLLLFASLFVISGTFQATGYTDQLVHWMVGQGFDPGRPTNEVCLTAGLSVLISNAPAVMLLVKVVPLTHATNGYLMAVANSFAGNAVVTASVANLIVVQQARRQGIVLSFPQFARLGIPITLLGLGGLIAWAALAGS